MARTDFHKKTVSQCRGHFASLWVPDGTSLIPTTITSQRKSHSKEKESAKKAKLITEMELQFGPISETASKYDGVTRRWAGVKGNGPDG
jgi:hypothetical protein